MNKKIIFPVIYLLLVIFMMFIVPEIADKYIWNHNELIWDNMERVNVAYAIFGLIIPLFLTIIFFQLYSKYPIVMIYALFLVVFGLFNAVIRLTIVLYDISSAFELPVVLNYIRSFVQFGLLLGIVLSPQLDKNVRQGFLVVLVVSVLQTVLFGHLTITILSRLNLIQQLYQVIGIVGNIFNLFSTVAMCYIIYFLFKEEEMPLETTEILE